MEHHIFKCNLTLVIHLGNISPQNVSLQPQAVCTVVDVVLIRIQALLEFRKKHGEYSRVPHANREEVKKYHWVHGGAEQRVSLMLFYSIFVDFAGLKRYRLTIYIYQSFFLVVILLYLDPLLSF